MLDPHDLAIRIREVREMIHEFEREHRCPETTPGLVIDASGLGRRYTDVFTMAYKMYAKEAERRNKKAFLDLTSGELRAGRIAVIEPQAECLVRAYMTTKWDDLRKDTFPGQDGNHPIDAMLYAWREIRHHAHQPVPPEPIPGTDEYAQAQARELERQAMEEFERRNQEGGFPEWDA
jgi:hypothetical protein